MQYELSVLMNCVRLLVQCVVCSGCAVYTTCTCAF
jgi:hypothetical protein